MVRPVFGEGRSYLLQYGTSTTGSKQQSLSMGHFSRVVRCVCGEVRTLGIVKNIQRRQLYQFANTRTSQRFSHKFFPPNIILEAELPPSDMIAVLNSQTWQPWYTSSLVLLHDRNPMVLLQEVSQKRSMPQRGSMLVIVKQKPNYQYLGTP